MMRLALASVALAILAGCASAPPAPATAPVAQNGDAAQVAAANPNERKQICVREQPIGSSIPVTRCHYEETGVSKAMEMDAFRSKINQTTLPRVPGSGS
jgi:hypothetical protein